VFRVFNSSLSTETLFRFIVLLTYAMINTLSIFRNLKEFLAAMYVNINLFHYCLPERELHRTVIFRRCELLNLCRVGGGCLKSV